MAELPIMPLKTDALLADTTHMSTEEFGAYCRILFVMWRQGGRLKDDDAEMAAIAGLPAARWRKIKEKVTRPMTLIQGTFSQKKLTETWIQVQELRKKRALASEVRWKGKRQPRGMQMHHQVDSNSNANQNQRIEPSLSEDRPSEVDEMQKGSSGGLKISPQLTAILARTR
jgi:uncharacterized protein YdaU (DUF1376 family)